jgi:hypothetical protein
LAGIEVVQRWTKYKQHLVPRVVRFVLGTIYQKVVKYPMTTKLPQKYNIKMAIE